ncbi:MAG: UDP-2,3-diacylglucosamine diphosphatase LpxI [Pseudomonadota bacterium]
MLALIAGAGDLPRLLYEALDPKPCVAAMAGFEPQAIPVEMTFRIETLGGLIADLASRGVRDVCFAGSIQRPPLDPKQVDAATLPLVPRMLAALQQGDDAALRIVLGFFEETGIEVRAAHEVLPSLLPPPGVLSERQPDDQATADINRAVTVVDAMGVADLGQSCIVSRSQVLAVEAVMGTDWMLDHLRVARAKSSSNENGLSDESDAADEDALQPRVFPEPLRRGGVLYKAPKPDQDLRVDMPVIGPSTVRGAAAALLDGIVIRAGSVMVLELEATVAAANSAGLFLWVHE